jgi:hypothetical protein
MGQQSVIPTSSPTAPSPRPHYSETSLATTPTPPTTTGQDLALDILQYSLIGGEISSQTNQLIHKQISQLVNPSTPPTETLNLLTALIMGSPEFQLR